MMYIVENVESDIERWCYLEYQHISKTVGKDNVIYANIPANQIDDLRKQIPGKFLECSASDLECVGEDARVVLLDVSYKYNPIRSNASCLMMDAEKELTPADADNFDVILVGGILGNVPSDDRTSEIRNIRQCAYRHLGSQQMTTNTAVLVAKLILEEKIRLEDIPIVDEPEMLTHPSARESVTLPFRFVAKRFLTGKESDNNVPILPEGMLEYIRESANDSVFSG